MIVAPFDLDSRPRVTAAEARATQAWLPLTVAIPPSWQTEAPASGAMSVRFGGFAFEPASDTAAALSVAIGNETVRMTVDAELASRLVDTALGGRGAFRAARSLGPAERGLLAALVGAAFRPIGWRPSAARPPSATPDGAELVFQLETPAGAGIVRVARPRTISDSGREDAMRARASRLSTAVSIEIARTYIPSGAIAGVVAGDAVVFDGHSASGGANDRNWKGTLTIGELPETFAAPVIVDASGQMTLADGLSPRERSMHEDAKEMRMEASDTTNATAALRAAPVEVVAEIGRLKLRGDEVLGLVAGTVLALPARSAEVALRVSGELFAEGELVNVDGELGVRVTRLVAR